MESHRSSARSSISIVNDMTDIMSTTVAYKPPLQRSVHSRSRTHGELDLMKKLREYSIPSKLSLTECKSDAGSMELTDGEIKNASAISNDFNSLYGTGFRKRGRDFKTSARPSSHVRAQSVGFLSNPMPQTCYFLPSSCPYTKPTSKNAERFSPKYGHSGIQMVAEVGEAEPIKKEQTLRNAVRTRSGASKHVQTAALRHFEEMDDVSRPWWINMLPIPSQLDLWPLAEMIQFITGATVYMNKKVREAKTPVFRVHCGLKTVIVADHTAGSFFLGAPETVFDREHQPRFGPSGVRKTLILGHGNMRPALLANADNGHAKIRMFSADIFRARAHDAQACFTRAMNRSSALIAYKLGKDINSVDVYNMGISMAGEFEWEWLVGTSALCGDDLKAWGFGTASHLQFDSFLSTAVFELLYFLDPASEIKRLTQVQLEKIRSSPHFDRYCEMADDRGIERDDLDRFLLYTVGFNGTLGQGLLLGGVIGILAAHMGDCQAIRDEINGHKLTLETIDEFPFLESFLYECLRFFIRPTVIYKTAKRDVAIPASNGKYYKVLEDELVMAWMPAVLRDATVFDSPNSFNSRRYLNNPELKRKVLAYGCVPDPTRPDSGKPSTHGCGYSLSGIANKVNKLFIAEIARRFDYTLDQEVATDFPYLGEVGPNGIKFSSFKLREH